MNKVSVFFFSATLAATTFVLGLFLGHEQPRIVCAGRQETFVKGIEAGEELTISELEEYKLLDPKIYDNFYVEHDKKWRTR